ncbi:hypothetical protein E2C01_011633 [Portunus trituberculatus]|uniref:Uncharacterized protein n=1 Tax=Portunus trituberculatus TaxID=210409 RepID=A0A5B7DBX6_PORTR|nr:hypothetical protein [Portunus trituberculatus]
MPPDLPPYTKQWPSIFFPLSSATQASLCLPWWVRHHLCDITLQVSTILNTLTCHSLLQANASPAHSSWPCLIAILEPFQARSDTKGTPVCLNTSPHLLPLRGCREISRNVPASRRSQIGGVVVCFVVLHQLHCDINETVQPTRPLTVHVDPDVGDDGRRQVVVGHDALQFREVVSGGERRQVEPVGEGAIAATHASGGVGELDSVLHPLNARKWPALMEKVVFTVLLYVCVVCGAGWGKSFEKQHKNIRKVDMVLLVNTTILLEDAKCCVITYRPARSKLGRVASPG